MTRMGRTGFLTLPTALRAGGPFASFASSAAQILVAALLRYVFVSFYLQFEQNPKVFSDTRRYA